MTSSSSLISFLPLHLPFTSTIPLTHSLIAYSHSDSEFHMGGLFGPWFCTTSESRRLRSMQPQVPGVRRGFRGLSASSRCFPGCALHSIAASGCPIRAPLIHFWGSMCLFQLVLHSQQMPAADTVWWQIPLSPALLPPSHSQGWSPAQVSAFALSLQPLADALSRSIARRTFDSCLHFLLKLSV